MLILVNIFICMLPEILFFTLFLIYAKNLKEKKFELFILITLAYILCITISRFKTLYYVSFIFLVYLILKILYKKKIQIIDIFTFSISTLYLTFISLLIFLPKTFNQYIICLIINRLLLFLPFIFRNKFNNLYQKYYSLWNRNYEKKQPIKSITIRNVSIMIINSVIFVINITCLYIINTLTK